MYNLYDIHTHQRRSSESEEYDVCSFVNIYPFDLDKMQIDDASLKFTCGVHPWYSEDYQNQLSILDGAVNLKSLVAIGEAGFDKLRGQDIEIQSKIFMHHALLAERYQKPLIIHCVKAWDELIAMHKKIKPTVSWIIHGYRGNPVQTRQLEVLGFKFSIGEKYNEESVKLIPDDSLFCETDMSEVSILNIYRQLAFIRSVELKELVSRIENNVKMTFCK